MENPKLDLNNGIEMHLIYKAHIDNCPNGLEHELLSTIKVNFKSIDTMYHLEFRTALQ